MNAIESVSPTADEDRAFVGWLAEHAADVSGRLNGDIASAEIGVSRGPNVGGLSWTASLRPHIARLECLRAMRAAIASGMPYVPPTADEIAEIQGRTIAALALAMPGFGPNRLLDTLANQAHHLRFEVEKAGRDIADLRGRGFSVEQMREAFVKASREVAGHRAELAAMDRTLEGFGPALAAIVAEAIEGAGGAEIVSRDLADAMRMESPSVHASEGQDHHETELATLRSRLAALGEDSQGRAAESLRGRIAELEGALGSLRAELRERGRSVATAEARNIVEGAMAARTEHLRKLSDAVSAQPDAFADGFGEALRSAPMRAFEVAGFPGIALITL